MIRTKQFSPSQILFNIKIQITSFLNPREEALSIFNYILKHQDLSQTHISFTGSRPSKPCHLKNMLLR